MPSSKVWDDTPTAVWLDTFPKRGFKIDLSKIPNLSETIGRSDDVYFLEEKIPAEAIVGYVPNTVDDFAPVTLESRQEDQPVPTEGIHVAKDKKADVSFANLIVSGDKKYETRDQNRTLRRFIGKRIGIIETGDGPAKLVGYATVGQPIEVNEAQFNELRDQHLVPKGSKFDIKEEKPNSFTLCLIQKNCLILLMCLR